MSQYAELHCHSAFSLLDGASSPEELIVRASEIGLSALALTDHNDLGGIVRFSQAAKEVGIEAIIGAEITLEDDSHLTLLVESVDGYKNLCHLITYTRLHCPRGCPRLPYSQLLSHRKGLVALTGCPHGKVPFSLARGDVGLAESSLLQLLEAFGDALYVEVWDHGIRQESAIARQLIELARSMTIPWVVTNNAHYAYPEKRIVHDVLTCLRHEVTLASAGTRLRPNGSWYLKSPQEMYHLWRHDPQGLKNTLVVAERCRFRLGLLKPSLPVFAVPDGGTSNGYLERLVWEGTSERYQKLTQQHMDQINHELTMITKLGLAPYFLIMWDIVRFAKSQGIAVQGRGSAANSAVCYCLKITAVDPIAMELLFERFLSDGRGEPPDIDLDIAHQEREKVLQYVYNKYGREHAAMVCEVVTYRGRSAVRDAARVLGFSQDKADRLAMEGDATEALEAARRLADGGVRNAGLDPKDRRVKLLIQVVAGLHQLPRHRSIHVGGFVLSGEPLGEMVPIETASMEGRTVIQWDKDDLEPVGMIKIDLLGLGMLTMIQEALKLVAKHRGIQLDLARLDMKDPDVYEMIARADTIGVFQVESRAQMGILPRLKPRCFYDIVVSIALVRPGPIQGNIIHPYVRRRLGKEPVTYLSPIFEPILKRTLGVPLFQEQGMRLAVAAAGFTPAQADELRRVMSHKRSKEKMEKLCADLARGMRANGLDDEAIATITHQLQAFSNYGFPESHSASFALLVYASAYLKRFFAPEFYCAMLNAQPMGFYSPDTLVRDALRHGVKILPVDLGKSAWDCTLEVESNCQLAVKKAKAWQAEIVLDLELGEKKKSAAGSATFRVTESLCLRLGLRYVQGLGKKSRQCLEAAWKTGGAFKSIEDVCRRSGLGLAALQLLARAGAFVSFCPDRRQAVWLVLAACRQRDMPLFKALDPTEQLPDEAGWEEQVNLPRMTHLESIVADYKTLGLSVDRHPMCFYRQYVLERGMKACADLSQAANGERVTVAGGVICRQRPATAKGFVFLTIEDETGYANIIVRPPLFQKLRKVILGFDFLAITGKTQHEEGVVNIVAEEIESLPALPGNIEIPSRNFH